MNSAEQLSSSSNALPKVIIVVVVALIVISTIRVIAVFLRPTFYALDIETAGTPRTVLVSTDGSQVMQLVHMIMDSIDNPQADFQLQVENFHVGDKIQQFGNQNVGKVSR